MNCKEVKYYITDYMNGHLIDEIRDDIEIHLQNCGSCKYEFAELNSVIMQAKSSNAAVHISHELKEEISKKVNQYRYPSHVQKTGEKTNHPGEVILNIKHLVEKSTRGKLIVLWGIIAMLFVITTFVLLYYSHGSSPLWNIEVVKGSPLLDNKIIRNSEILKVGGFIITDKASYARLSSGLIGNIDINPKSKIKFTSDKVEDYRIALMRGSIEVNIWAPPTFFSVETSAGTVVDLGCKYKLNIAEDGNTYLKVSSGWAGFKYLEKQALLCEGTVCQARPLIGPGTPYFEDASVSFKNALIKFDFENGGTKEIDTLLKEAREKDVFTLWNLLPKVKRTERSIIFYKMIKLVPVPEGITYKGVIEGNKEMLEEWWEFLGYGKKSLWRYMR